ncbi:MAG: metallopeptidase family protein [Candidatus Handelsmanbacteria bacterium]|nr:metallopeptidase family protein [Candidatus Handelsmanbacteria bacterium]
MNRRRFEKLVQQALEKIPQPFQQALQNVAILIEDWPDPEIAEEITGDPDEWLYGLFSGTPLPERRLEDSGDLPAVITLYQRPLEEDFPNHGDLVEEIEITLVHEIAHFMGFDEETLREFGYD